MVNKVIAVYPGRFQPMGRHHAATFKWLQDKFGKENTYIVTSDKVEMPKSPLNFQEKKASNKIRLWRQHSSGKKPIQSRRGYRKIRSRDNGYRVYGR